jgi:HK97 family phage major capsid protein
MNYAELIKQKLASMEELLNKAKTENRVLNDAEKSLYEDFKKEITNLEASASAEADLNARKDELKKTVTKPIVAIHAEANTHAPKWKNLGEFLKCVHGAYAPGGQIDNRLMVENAATGMSSSVASDGGFAIDEQFVGTLQQSMVDASDIVSRITMIPTGAGYGGIKMPALDETSRADGSRWGGVRAYWASEAGTASASKAKVRKLSIDLEKLLAFVYVTDELLTDATALENYIKMAYADEMSFKINDAIINGDGIGKPLGLTNSAALLTIAAEAGQGADTVLYENIVKMWNRLPIRHRRTAVWLINQEIEPQLFGMSLVIGTSGVPVYMPANGITGNMYSTIFGRPVIPVEQCSKLGDKGDIILTDLSAYIGTEKGGTQMDSSIHVQFLYDEQVFRFRYRFNGAPYYNSPVASYKNAAFTYSPYITLAAR